MSGPRTGVALCLLVVGSACGGESNRLPEAAASQESASPGGSAATVGVATLAVVGQSGPGGRAFSVARRTEGLSAASRLIGTRTFEVALRSAPLVQLPCTSCHAGPQVSAARARDAHQNIQAVHPSVSRGACGTCHARANVARLVLPTGETASLDEAYRVCAQCHSPQTEAWAGGAHGKRLVAWSGERVVLTCTECHDPHAPTTPQREPFRGPVLP